MQAPREWATSSFKHVFDHGYDKSRVRRVSITPSSDDRRGFEELPENDLDKSDRKFLATALVAGAAILNATDSDWSGVSQIRL